MATITPQPTINSRRKIHSLKTDMTPMVDLGFLRITFFIFTATVSQPTVTKLIMPKDGDDTFIPQSKALTLLLDKDKAFCYEGLWKEALLQNRIMATGYNLQTGLGNVIREKQKRMKAKDELVVLIKPRATSSYQNVITALDEMKINNVKNYALLAATAEEKSLLQKR